MVQNDIPKHSVYDVDTNTRIDLSEFKKSATYHNFATAYHNGKIYLIGEYQRGIWWGKPQVRI